MGRIIIRDLVIACILCSLLFIGIFNFSLTLTSNYGGNIDDRYLKYKDNMTSNLNSINAISEAQEKLIEEDSGVGETTSGDELSTTQNIIKASKMILDIPALFITFLQQITEIIGLEDYYFIGFVAVFLFIVLMIIVSGILRKDT